MGLFVFHVSKGGAVDNWSQETRLEPRKWERGMGNGRDPTSFRRRWSSPVRSRLIRPATSSNSSATALVRKPRRSAKRSWVSASLSEPRAMSTNGRSRADLCDRALQRCSKRRTQQLVEAAVLTRTSRRSGSPGSSGRWLRQSPSQPAKIRVPLGLPWGPDLKSLRVM